MHCNSYIYIFFSTAIISPCVGVLGVLCLVCLHVFHTRNLKDNTPNLSKLIPHLGTQTSKEGKMIQSRRDALSFP